MQCGHFMNRRKFLASSGVGVECLIARFRAVGTVADEPDSLVECLEFGLGNG